MSNSSSKQGKLARYRALKLKEKARALSQAEGIAYERALEIVHEREKESQRKRSLLGKGKSKSAQKKASRRAKAARHKAVKSFGNKLVPGAPPLQGGSPGLGKKS